MSYYYKFECLDHLTQEIEKQFNFYQWKIKNISASYNMLNGVSIIIFIEVKNDEIEYQDQFEIEIFENEHYCVVDDGEDFIKVFYKDEFERVLHEIYNIIDLWESTPF